MPNPNDGQTKSDEIMWQNNVPPSPHNGGWGLIMLCTVSLANSDCYGGTEGAQNAFEFRAKKIAEHGEVPDYYAKAWLSDYEATYTWLSRKSRDAHSINMLAAIRAVAKRMCDVSGD